MMLVLGLIALAAAFQAPAQVFTGRWSGEEDGQTVVLDLSHDVPSGRVSGTMTMLGATVPVEGRVRSGTLALESLGGIPLSATGGSMTGRLSAGSLLFTVAAAGDAPKTMTMRRGPDAADGKKSPPRPAPAPEGRAAPPPPPATGSAGAQDFNGRWELVSDDKTTRTVLELAVSPEVSGTLAVIERGYFSGRETIKERYEIRGSLRGSTLDVTLTDGSGRAAASILRRGEYIVIRMGQQETGLARPGRGVVESAEGSAEAAALVRAVAGRVYSVTAQASGRGAYVGSRVRLALCADGRIEYDASDLAATPGGLPGQGVDLGSSVTRRGTWSVVLVAGAPAVRAQWQGTGTSYSLTRYFVIRPSADGRSAVIDGKELPATGKC